MNTRTDNLDLGTDFSYRPKRNWYEVYERGDRGRRFFAYVIDTVIAAFLILPTGFIIGILAVIANTEITEDDELTTGLISLIIPTLYFLFKDGFKGRSLGKRVCGLMVIDIKRQKPCGFGRSALRSFIFYALSSVPIVGIFIEPFAVLNDRDGRRLGDKAAGTVVINNEDYQHEMDYEDGFTG